MCLMRNKSVYKNLKRLKCKMEDELNNENQHIAGDNADVYRFWSNDPHAQTPGHTRSSFYANPAPARASIGERRGGVSAEGVPSCQCSFMKKVRSS